MKNHILKFTIYFLLLTVYLEGNKMAFAQDGLFDVAQFYPMLQANSDKQPISLSYLSKNWPELEQWRILGRAKMQELLAFQPESIPLNPKILETTHKDGYTKYLVSYAITPFRSTEAFLLIPNGLTKPAPAVIALHDHSGFYFYGKEKIVETEGNPEVLSKMYDVPHMLNVKMQNDAIYWLEKWLTPSKST